MKKMQQVNQLAEDRSTALLLRIDLIFRAAFCAAWPKIESARHYRNEMRRAVSHKSLTFFLKIFKRVFNCAWID